MSIFVLCCCFYLLCFVGSLSGFGREEMKSVVEEVVAPMKRKLDEAFSEIPNKTPTTVSKIAVKNLHPASKVVFTPIAEQPAILNQAEMRVLRALTNEESVVEYMTPHLQRVFNSLGLMVVNSERLPWLVEPNGEKKKPDIYLIPVWGYTKRTHDSSGNQDDVNRRFGTVEDTRLYDLVRLFNCNCSVDNHARGECIMHMQLLTHKQTDASQVTRGSIFGKKFLELLEVNQNVLTRMETVDWTSGGSVKCIQDFIGQRASPWYAAPQLLLAHTTSTFVIADPHKIPNLLCSFLGAGALGRVVLLATTDPAYPQRQQLSNYVLKMCLLADSVKLSSERHRLKKHAEQCECSCMARPCSELLLAEGLCGYILSPAGLSQVTRLQLKQEGKTIFLKVGQALHRLHDHNPSIIHGDPRIHNLINARGEQGQTDLFWVDLADSPGTLSDNAAELSIHFKCEVIILVESMWKGMSEVPEIAASIEIYADSVTVYAMNVVMELAATFVENA